MFVCVCVIECVSVRESMRESARVHESERTHTRARDWDSKKECVFESEQRKERTRMRARPGVETQSLSVCWGFCMLFD